MEEFNPETASMDELRKAAEAEAAKASTTTVTEPTTKTVVADPPATVGPFEFKRTIDLGDGAGVQVFTGKGDSRESAWENLSDKLADAQKHATAKIRELSAKVKTAPTETVVSKEDEALYSAELLATPTTAFRKMFKAVTGVDVEEFKTVTAREKAFQEARSKKSVADQFVAAHPDFLDNERNGQLINRWLTLHNDFSLEGFNKAYTDLNESGLLQVKSVEACAEQKKAEAEVQRIADAAEAASSLRTKKSSGISTQRRTTTPVATELSEEEMEALPLDELRRRANRQLAAI